MVFKRRRDEDEFDFDYFFDDFEEEFKRMNERISRILNELSRHMSDVQGPFVYGFTMKIGPDGKPRIEEFGNVPKVGIGELEGYREPLVDVSDDEKNVYVTAELPGVEKEQINLQVDENTIIIKTDVPERKYYKVIELPERVKPETAKASYHNGILDVTIEKEQPKKKGGTRVKID
ncbi:MAG: archaeal heat shock protein Hsp20 [Thermoplasmata archaeon]|nr:Hsp20/alpha crystallin family protein [Staphylococcus epidermidis]